MTQEIITYIILIIVCCIIIYKTIDFFDVFRKKGNTADCYSCASGSCSACSLKPSQKTIQPIRSISSK